MADPRHGLIDIELVYALPQEQAVLALKVPPGTTVGQAIALSGIIAMHPEINPESMVAGIFGRRVVNSAVVHAHDRVEIYRPLIADPKQVRRGRAGKSVNSKR